MKALALTLLACLGVAIAACGGASVDTPAALQDPETCKECHTAHFDQWSGSMHAYASVDPVFVAMNKRGQRETNNKLGTFCVQCHAPMAVALGLTDGTDFDPATLPAAANGITCYFCHNVDKVVDTHNNGLELALDSTMRGGLKKPESSPAHSSAYDPLMDGEINDSSMCGSCHDIVTPNGIALERTFQEWQSTFFTESDPLHHLTCTGCHMRSSSAPIANASLGTPPRTNGFHDHTLPGVDQALTTFPHMDDQAIAVGSDLDVAVGIVGPTPSGGPPTPGGICVDQQNGGEITVRMDALSVGHAWPSGATQDRRAWVEVIAKDASGTVVFSSGVVPDDKDPEDIGDPNLYELYDRALKSDGTPAHLFEDVASDDCPMTDLPCLLKPPTTLDKNSPAFDHSTTKSYPIGSLITTIQTVTAQVHIRAYDLATLDDLVSSGDLDPAVIANVKTLDILGTQRNWDKATSGMPPAQNTGCSPH